MHRCHVSEVGGTTVVLEGAEAHHVRHVLRLGIDAPVAVFDGRGHEWTGAIAAIGRGTVTIAGLTPGVPVPEPTVAVTLAVGLVKGEAMSAVVRDAVMLGAAVVVPLASSHTARPARSGDLSARWARVALASARQCGRAVVPPVRPAASLDAVLAEPFAARLVCVEPSRSAGTPAGAFPARPAGSALVLVGPEGGWSPAELVRIEATGAHRFDLGPRTLRAEAAPAVALASLWTRWGWT